MAILIALIVALLPTGMASSATTTILSSTPNPSTFGQVVTLTATVSPTSATGKVTFYDGVTVLGTSMLSGGRATLNTILLPSGNGSLREIYSGDTSFAASASAAITQTVVALPQNGFLPAVNYNVGSSPGCVALGDFNGDGKADLVVGNYFSNSVSVLLGKGDGTFQTGVNSNASAPTSLAVADFNGDGKADLVVGNDYEGYFVSVLLGNGDWTFQAAVNYEIGSIHTYTVAVGDFNGDGKADIVVANLGAGPIPGDLSVLLGNGDGTFKAAVNYTTYAAGSPFAVAVGDFNGDGKADLAVANLYGNNVSVLLGNGDGTFQAATNYNVGTAPFSVAAGDFNGDGKLDLAVANSGSSPARGNVSVLLGRGDGTFQAAVNYNAGISPRAVAVGDFNGDGKADLVVANGGSSGTNVSVLLGNGSGTFSAAVNYNAGAFPADVAVGDFSGDGRSDLAVANINGNNVSVLLGLPVGPTPVINTGGVVTGANYAAPLGPGVIATLFGANLSSGNVLADGVPLPATLGGVSVSANAIPVPLFFVSPTQINFQLPWELLGQNQASIVATVSGSPSAPQTVSVLGVSPGIFSTNSSGSGQGAIQISNTAIFAAPANSIQGAPARPAQRAEFLTIYCSGLGDVSPRPATGAPASGNPLSNTLLMPSVTIGGASVPVSFAGLSPGFVGLYQVNVQVPSGAPSGGQVPVVMTIGGVSSNTVTIAVQ